MGKKRNSIFPKGVAAKVIWSVVITFLVMAVEIVLYTDGVTEARNMDGDMFGEQRLKDALNEAKGFSLDKIDEHVRKRISEFVGEAEQYDDITTLCFKYLG